MPAGVLPSMDDDGPLDFEAEDLLLNATSPPPPKCNKRKIIGLDDLLTEHYKEQGRLVHKPTRRKTISISKCYNSDEDNEEVTLSKLVDDCHKQVDCMGPEEELNLWGLQIFGPAKSHPTKEWELESCELFRSFTRSEHNSMLGLCFDSVGTFFEGLLTNGWLTKLVFSCGLVEKVIGEWTFDLMMYSKSEELQTSACDFWMDILASKDQVDKALAIQWLPKYTQLQSALEAFGYHYDVSLCLSSSSKTNHDVECQLRNIKSWAEFVSACCNCRRNYSILSTSEVEQILSVFVSFFLDRRLQGLSHLLVECLVSIVNYFTDEEWRTSSLKAIASITSRVPKDMNCLRMVNCIHGNSARTKQLRSLLAYQILINCIDTKVANAEDLLRFLISTNVKDKGCDFFKIYIYLVLAENWLFSCPLLEEKPLIREMWILYLRNCSSQITSTDWRSHALKVRNRASYLLQATV